MAKKKKKQKKQKKKKLDSIPKINRRLFKIWSLAVRGRAGNKCEFCGLGKGDIGASGNPINKIDAHHLLSRDIKDCPLKFDIMNSVAVCPFHHKFGIPSFHRDPITTITWLQENRPDRYEYILINSKERVDLQNRKVLEQIEISLKQNMSLDIKNLQEIEKLFPRQSQKGAIETGDIFNDI